MSRVACSRERELLDALAAGHVSEELRNHAASCGECSESLLVGSFLRRGAAEAMSDPPPLPDAGYLWWRARLDRRAAASERATRVITLVQRAALVSAGLLTVPIFRWAWPHLRAGLDAVNPAALAPSLPAEAGRPGLVIAVSLLVVASIALLDNIGNWLEH
jgi:hypothetical protein